MNITIYTKSNCPNCVLAKNALRFKELPYEEVDMESFPETFDLMLRNNPQIKQMPAIWINGQYVGGFAGLQAALKQVGV